MFGEVSFSEEPFSSGVISVEVFIIGLSLPTQLGCFQFYAWAEIPDGIGTFAPTNTWAEPNC